MSGVGYTKSPQKNPRLNGQKGRQEEISSHSSVVPSRGDHDGIFQHWSLDSSFAAFL